MPLYEFRCKNEECGEKFEELYSFKDIEENPDVTCPVCKGVFKAKDCRIISNTAFIFDGQMHSLKSIGEKQKQMRKRNR